MKKSEFKELAKSGLMFIGSFDCKKDELNVLMQKIEKSKFKVFIKNRFLMNNTDTSLKFQLRDKSFSYLNISGKDCKIEIVDNAIFVITENFNLDASSQFYFNIVAYQFKSSLIEK